MKYLVASILLGTAIAGAQDFSEIVKQAYNLSEDIRTLGNQKYAIEQKIFEAQYKRSNLMTVRMLVDRLSKADNLYKGCKVDFDGKNLKIKNDTGNTATWEVYNPGAYVDLVNAYEFVSARFEIDVDSYTKRVVVVRLETDGAVHGFYAEQYYSDHGTRSEWIARCWPN